VVASTVPETELTAATGLRAGHGCLETSAPGPGAACADEAGAFQRLDWPSMRTMTPDGEAANAPGDVLDTPEAGSLAIRGSGVRALGYVVGSLLTLASAPLLVRHLGVVDFGRYFTVVSLVALVAGITDVGLATVALREFSARTGADRDDFMRQVLGARVALTILGVLGATGFAAAAGYGNELVLGTFVAGVGLLLTVVGHTYSIPLFVHLRIGRLTAVDVAIRAVGVALVLGLIILSAGILEFIATAVVTSALALVATLAMTRGQVPLRPSLRTGELRELMRATLPLAVATVLGSLYTKVVIIIMSVSASDLITGYFGTAARVIEVGVGIPFTLVATTFPIFARAATNDPERFRYVLQRVLEIAVILGLWMTIVTVLGADFMSSVLVTDPSQAAPVAQVLRVLAPMLTLVFLSLTTQTALIALHAHRQLLIINATALAAIIVLTLLLVPLFAQVGGGCAVIAGEAVLFITSTAFLLRERPDVRLDLRPLPGILLAGAVASAAVLLPVPALVRLLAATVAFFGTLALVGGIPAEVRQAYRRGPSAATAAVSGP